MDFERIEKVFKEYVLTYDWSCEKVKMKYYHTLEVANISHEVASAMGLSDEDKDLAKLIGYLHDIARFEQLKRVNSFNDKLLDHADLAIEILFDEGLIRKFIQTDKYDSIIRKAVRNHNKLKILDEVDSKEEMFVKLIRDCDKIDILRIRAEDKKDVIIETPCPEVINAFREERSVDLSKRASKADGTYCVIAFVFDINYKESLKCLNEKGYYHKFISGIEVSSEQKELFDRLSGQALKKLEV